MYIEIFGYQGVGSTVRTGEDVEHYLLMLQSSSHPNSECLLFPEIRLCLP